MRRALLTVTCGAAFSLLNVPVAQAMGFGRTITATTLGQPLNFAAVLALDSDENLARECVSADVLIGDVKVLPENIRVTLEAGREVGERRVRVTTRVPVDEPIVTVNVVVGCGSQVSRRFVSFIDPPAVNLARAEPESLPPQRVDNQVVPLMDIVRRADETRRDGPKPDAAPRRLASAEVADAPKRARRGAGRGAAAIVVARSEPLRPARETKARTSTSKTIAPSNATMAAVRTAPRLRLDAAAGLAPTPRTTVAAVAPAALSALAATVPPVDPAGAQIIAAQAAVDAASSALGRERDRIQMLEAGMARLKSDSDGQQKTLLEMQARLRQAEGERYANGLVYALSAGMLFFAALAAAFWALRPRQRRRARWFDEAAKREKLARAAAGAPVPAAAWADAAVASVNTVSPVVSQHPSQWDESSRGMLVTAPASIGGLEVTTVLAPQSSYSRMAQEAASANASTSGEATRALSSPIEELIDLEQQAEFFVVLGQDEAAIALLDAHLHSIGATSPLPYLQLLEIHQRRGDQDAYEKVRLTFERQFKAFAPEWSSDIHFGRSLDEYPQAVARLQSIWSMPLHAMEQLDGLLFRRAENDDSFDFPAYRDLLFLYSIARDRAGNVETEHGPIDLLLPLDDAPTEPMPVGGDSMFAVDLDVSSWPGNEPTEGMVIRRSVGRRGAGG